MQDIGIGLAVFTQKYGGVAEVHIENDVLDLFTSIIIAAYGGNVHVAVLFELFLGDEIRNKVDVRFANNDVGGELKVFNGNVQDHTVFQRPINLATCIHDEDYGSLTVWNENVVILAGGTLAHTILELVCRA